MGGRLDATNMVRPLISVVTPVAFDHEAMLGNSLVKIAYEKAGIIKRQGLTVSALQRGVVRDVLVKIAKRRCNDIHFVRPQAKEKRLWVQTAPLLGSHQYENAYLACKVLALLRTRHGFARIPVNALSELTSQSFCIPGRLECVAKKPRVFVDGAHNAAAIDASLTTIVAYARERSVVLVFGLCNDKSIERIVPVLKKYSFPTVVTQGFSPRARSAASIAGHCAHDGMLVEPMPRIKDALRCGREYAGTRGIVLVIGSFYLVSAVKRLIELENKRTQR